MSRWKIWIIALCAFTASVQASHLVTDSQLGYLIRLPDHWIKEIADTAERQFIDTSFTYKSMIALVRYDINADTLFSARQEWTRANFIAYVLSIQSDALSALMYYDTVAAWQNDTLWAADAFSHFYPLDTTIGNYAEYIRFTECGRYGYEIYAIGAIADIDSNINFYKGIIDSIILPSAPLSVLNPNIVHRVSRYSLLRPSASFNLLGRNLGGRSLRNRSSQIIIRRNGKSFFLK